VDSAHIEAVINAEGDATVELLEILFRVLNSPELK
jgi:hypothetical protein